MSKFLYIKNEKIAIMALAILTIGCATFFACAQNASAADNKTVSLESLATEKNSAESEIEAKIQTLNNLQADVTNAADITYAQRRELNVLIQGEMTNLTLLEINIDADTNMSSAIQDINSANTLYNVFDLIMPKARLIIAANIAETAISSINTVANKIKLRTSAITVNGAFSTAYSDFNAKIADATKNAEASIQAATLVSPSNDAQKKMAADIQNLNAANANLKTAISDLTAARDEANELITNLR